MGGVRRINKRLNKGESIQSARHNEAVKKQKFQAAKPVIAKGTSLGVGAGVGAAATVFLNKKMNVPLNQALVGGVTAGTISSSIANRSIRVALAGK